MEAIKWQGLIHSDRGILSGKPVVKGTRLSVEFLLELFAAGWTQEQVFESYPTLSREGLRAAFAYAAESVAENTVVELGDAVEG